MSEQILNRILLIDDDTDDCFHFEQALKEINPGLKFYCCNKCEGVIDQLAKILPDLIFLDINMPVTDGFDCIKQIRSQKEFKKIPVVMYSTSQNEKDINISYGFGASLYFHKPESFAKLKENLREILQLNWFDPGSISMKHYSRGKYNSYPEK